MMNLPDANADKVRTRRIHDFGSSGYLSDMEE